MYLYIFYYELNIPLHIFMANYMNIISIPAYLVPNGGFMTTRSTIFGLDLMDLTSQLIRSNDAPYTFSSNTYLA
jgi:hypothetical protein